MSGSLGFCDFNIGGREAGVGEQGAPTGMWERAGSTNWDVEEPGTLSGI